MDTRWQEINLGVFLIKPSTHFCSFSALPVLDFNYSLFCPSNPGHLCIFRKSFDNKVVVFLNSATFFNPQPLDFNLDAIEANIMEVRP